MSSVLDAAKIMPALIGGALLLSLTYEAAYFYPLGLGFLAYFDTQDFIRSVFVWLPVYLAVGAADLFIAALSVVNRKLDAEIERLAALRVERGLPPIPAMSFRSGLCIVAQGVGAALRKWQLYVAIVMLLIALVNFTLTIHLPIAIGFTVLGICFLFQCSREFLADYFEAASELIRQPNYWIISLVTAFAVAGIWGGNRGRADLERPESVRVQLSGSPSGDNPILQCNVLRHLSSAFIAICNGKVFVAKSADVWLMKYDVPVPEAP